MATDSQRLDSVNELATCPICQDLFTDARSLSCGHSFCLMCLLGIQNSEQQMECPNCRQNTIPAKRRLRGLEPNGLANDLALILHRRGYSASEAQTGPAECASPGEAQTQQQDSPPPYSEAVSSSQTEDSDRTTSSQQDRTAAEEGQGAEAPSVEYVLSRLALGAASFMADWLPKPGMSGHNTSATVHKGVQCDHCGEEDISGARFKCGICDNYDLCESCEGKPRQAFHNPKHLFIKLKRPQQSPVLCMSEELWKPVVRQMSQSMDVSSSRHVNVVCDVCRNALIEGVRYKCSLCYNYDLCSACEQQSLSLHDEDHPFIKVDYPCPINRERFLPF